MFELKTISRDSIPNAREKADRYRLLGQPRLAESICKDILTIEPEDQRTLVALLLAITEQFGKGRPRMHDALEVVERIDGDFEQTYYRGLVYERAAIAQLGMSSPASGHIAYDWFRRAMEWFERAEGLSPPGNDDALLRWNTCARIINANEHIRPAPESRPPAMLE
jgi:hypothetical protein